MESFIRPVFLPVILGTSRQGRASEHAARFVFEEVSKRPDMETELIDIRNLRFPIDDAGEAIKDSQFSATVGRADGLILVVPEYNHSFPGLLKHVLDTNLEEYIHKAVGVCGVSAGPLSGRAKLTHRRLAPSQRSRFSAQATPPSRPVASSKHKNFGAELCVRWRQLDRGMPGGGFRVLSL